MIHTEKGQTRENHWGKKYTIEFPDHRKKNHKKEKKYGTTAK